MMASMMGVRFAFRLGTVGQQPNPALQLTRP
jgi:hypothetical protein